MLFEKHFEKRRGIFVTKPSLPPAEEYIERRSDHYSVHFRVNDPCDRQKRMYTRVLRYT